MRKERRKSNRSNVRGSLARSPPSWHAVARMRRDNEQPKSAPTIPFREVLESRFVAKIVVYESGGQELPGGSCGCCGGGPNATPDWRGDPWYVYRAGICDSDGVFYGMLCEGCLEDIRDENARRPQTERDEIAREVTELLGDDIDGAQTTMDDLHLGG